MYKIEFFYNGSKTKHKLYDSKTAFDKWWAYHLGDCQRMNAYEKYNRFSGLRAWENGAVIKEAGVIKK